MRILGAPDPPYLPRNELEAHLCAVLQMLSGQDVCGLQTREEYRASHWDEHEAPIDPGYDFMVKTSTKSRDWYTRGTEYGVNVTDGKITTLQETGRWMC